MNPLAVALLPLALLGAPAPSASDSFSLGVEAYRRGSYEEAEAHWLVALEEPLTDADLARVAFDLGNAAWRQAEPLQAVGWYEVARRHAPRDGDVWHNLELARAEAGMEPADRGDLSSTVDRITGSLLPHEARRLALALGIVLGLCLLVEAVHGGRLWRRLSLIALAACALGLVPWVRTCLVQEADPLLVVRAPSVALRSEPRRELSAIGKLDAGAEVERIDELTGWVRVETRDGLRGWLQSEAVFALDRRARGG